VKRRKQTTVNQIQKEKIMAKNTKFTLEALEELALANESKTHKKTLTILKRASRSQFLAAWFTPPDGDAVKNVKVLKNGQWRVQLTDAWARWMENVTMRTDITPAMIIKECLTVHARGLLAKS
jgi:hypothetical protein